MQPSARDVLMALEKSQLDAMEKVAGPRMKRLGKWWRETHPVSRFMDNPTAMAGANTAGLLAAGLLAGAVTPSVVGAALASGGALGLASLTRRALARRALLGKANVVRARAGRAAIPTDLLGDNAQRLAEKAPASERSLRSMLEGVKKARR